MILLTTKGIHARSILAVVVVVLASAMSTASGVRASNYWLEEELPDPPVAVFGTTKTRQSHNRTLMMSDGAQLGFVTVVVLLFCTALAVIMTTLMGFIIFCCRNNRTTSAEYRALPPEVTTSGAPTSSLCTNIQSPDERRVYVADLLKIKKHETKGKSDDNGASMNCSKADIEVGEEEAKSSSPSENCAICLEVYKTDNFVCLSNNPTCSHTFHHSCMSDWLLKHDECPVCRRSYLFE